MVIIECQQGDDKWWLERRGIPTGSEFDRIVTSKKGEYAAAAKGYIAKLIADRLDPYYEFRRDEYQTAAMRNGTIMEPRIRKLYEFERMLSVKQVGFCLTDDRRIGCSPDSLVGDDGVLEIKSPQPQTQIRYLLDGILPNEYKCQCHGHLIVTGRKWCDFMSYCNGLPDFVVRIEPDEFTDRMREVIAMFLAEYDAAWSKIESMIPPPPPPVIKDYGRLGTVEQPQYVIAF
jgi:hypothetical protein